MPKKNKGGRKPSFNYDPSKDWQTQPKAKQLAKSNNIELFDGDELNILKNKAF
jgi:hypothetical protein